MGDKRPRRITLVISSLGAGGAERVAAELCEALADRGLHVTLLTLSGSDRDAYHLATKICRIRIDIRRPAKNWLQSAVFTLIQLKRIRQAILSSKPDTVLSFVDQTNVRVIASLLFSRVPVIVSERTNPALHPLGSIWKYGRLLTYPFARRIVVQTQQAYTWCERNLWKFARNGMIIPNSVREGFADAPASSTNQSPLKRRLIAVGRLESVKGFDILLEAFALSELASDNWKLVILGEGDERAALSALSQRLNLNDAIEMPGRVNNVDVWLRSSDVFVLSSRYEGFPNALIEAMQCGMPCVSFDCPNGPADIIKNEVNGLLVAAGDKKLLAVALRRLADNAALRQELGREALRVRDQFSTTVVYDSWLNAISVGIDSAPSGSAKACDNGRGQTRSK